MGESHFITLHRGEGGVYLQHAAHPLEAVLLGGVGPLLRHDDDPLIMKHRDGEHRYPETQSNRLVVLFVGNNASSRLYMTRPPNYIKKY